MTTFDPNRNKGDKLRTIRRRMAYLDEKAKGTRAGKAQRGEWLALRWAVLVIVERYPHLRRPEDDKPVPHYMTALVNDEHQARTGANDEMAEVQD